MHVTVTVEATGQDPLQSARRLLDRLALQLETEFQWLALEEEGTFGESPIRPRTWLRVGPAPVADTPSSSTWSYQVGVDFEDTSLSVPEPVDGPL